MAGVIRDGRGSERIAKAIALASKVSFEKMFPFYSEKTQKKEQRAQKINELKALL